MMRYYIFLLALVCTSCLEPIEFKSDSEEEVLLVVDGGISTQDGPYQVQLSRATPYGQQIRVPETRAQLWVRDDVGNEEALEEIEAGVYEWPGTRVHGVVGRSYELEIRLANGKTYRSQPEKIEPPLPLDSLRFDVEIEAFTNSIGRITELKFAQVFANLQLPDTSNQFFLRWDWESIFVFYDQGRVPKVCYIETDLEPQRIAIFDGTQFAPGAVLQTEVLRHVPDFSFNWRRSYRVFQHRISAKAHAYYAQLIQLSNPQGTILDPPPAKIRGNIYNVNDPSEYVGGFFEASSVTEAVLFVTRPDISAFIFLDVPCTATHPQNISFSVCTNCLLFENSTLERPSYWP